VETVASLLRAFTWSARFAAAFCDKRGKVESLASISKDTLSFIHFPQQVLRIFFNSSAQVLAGVAIRKVGGVGE